jgi:hypothetical protein
MHALNLPPYVMLHIVDWLPHMLAVSHYRKITAIIDTGKSIRRVRAAREASSPKKTKQLQ